MKANKFVMLGVAAMFGVAACSDTTGPKGEVPVLPPVTDQTTILFLDDFDNENGGRGVYDWTNFQKWNVVSGCVDLHGNGFHDVQPGRGLYVDLDGTCNEGGTIETKAAFDLQPGTYVLEYWLAGNQRIRRSDTVDVKVGTIFTRTHVKETNDAFTMYTDTLNVTQATSARVSFRNHGADNQGALLDLVRLRRIQQ
jgi:hypothetical protein